MARLRLSGGGGGLLLHVFLVHIDMSHRRRRPVRRNCGDDLHRHMKPNPWCMFVYVRVRARCRACVRR
jgi:hypothetical protein